MNEVNISVGNSDVNGYYCCINSPTGSVIRNHNSIYYTNKRDEISTKECSRGNNGLTDGVDIDDMLPVSSPNQYSNMGYNNEHNYL